MQLYPAHSLGHRTRTRFSNEPWIFVAKEAGERRQLVVNSATQQPMQWQIGGLASNIPKRDIDGANRMKKRTRPRIATSKVMIDFCYVTGIAPYDLRGNDLF